MLKLAERYDSLQYIFKLDVAIYETNWDEHNALEHTMGLLLMAELVRNLKTLTFE
jgi:hypothetical protein